MLNFSPGVPGTSPEPWYSDGPLYKSYNKTCGKSTIVHRTVFSPDRIAPNLDRINHRTVPPYRANLEIQKFLGHCLSAHQRLSERWIFGPQK